MPADNKKFVINKDPFVVVGRVVACKCGRRLLVEATSAMPRTLPRLGASCLECVEITDKFREQSPEVAGMIERWKAELNQEES